MAGLQPVSKTRWPFQRLRPPLGFVRWTGWGNVSIKAISYTVNFPGF